MKTTKSQQLLFSALFAVLVMIIVNVWFTISQKSMTETPSASVNTGSVQSHPSYEIEITSDIAEVKPNTPTPFSFKIINNEGDVLKDFSVVHEKIMHLILVRTDLQQFQHLHPEFDEDTGEYSQPITFPTEGVYRVFPDFTPGTNNPYQLPVTVFADVEVGQGNAYEQLPVVPDTESTKKVGELDVTYQFPELLPAQTPITFSLSINSNGSPLTNLEPYLGAKGHSVILKKDSLEFIHTHALESTIQPSLLEFEATFPDRGTYKIFTQFQINGQVQTSEYVVSVEVPAPSDVNEPIEHSPGH